MGLEAETTTTEVTSEAAMETGDRDYIPGLDLDGSDANADRLKDKKVPYSKPIPRNFQAQWNDMGKPDEAGDTSREIKDVITQLEGNPDRSSLPTAMMVSGRRITILRMSEIVYLLFCFAFNHSSPIFPLSANSPLEGAVMDGMDAVNNLINSGGVPELADIVAQTDFSKRLRVEHKIHLIFEESPMDVDMQKQQQQQQQQDHHHQQHRGMGMQMQHRDNNNHGHHPQWNHQQPPPMGGPGPWNRGPPPHGPPPRRPGNNNHNNNGDRNRGGGGGRWQNNRRN